MCLLKFKRLVIFCIAALLTGCASDQYVPPTQGPTAMMAFNLPDVGEDSNTILVSTYKDQYKCTSVQNIKVILYSNDGNQSPAPFKIKAGSLFTIAISNNVVNKKSGKLSACGKVISFYPKPNEFYFMQTSINKEAKKCYFTLNKVADNYGDTKVLPKFMPVHSAFVRKIGHNPLLFNLPFNLPSCVDELAR